MVAREVFEVLYSPVKAFKKIVEKPDVKGVLLILTLILLTTGVAQYVNASKLFLETATPDEDDWTGSTSLWNSTGIVSIDETDRIVGDYSVTSFVSNGAFIWMKITGIGEFNCSGDSDYKGLSFRIKWIHQNGIFPSSNATLRLFSNSESRYFELDMIKMISNSSEKWANITVNTGPESQGWVPFGSPDWESITGLEFGLNWLDSDAANLTMKIDDLYFGKYVSFVTIGFYSQWFILSLVSTAMDFLIKWLLYAVLLWLVIKMFHGESGSWRILFIVIGYTFCNGIVHVPVETLLISTLPPLDLPLKAWNPIAGEEGVASELISKIYENEWYNTLSYNLSLFLTLAIYAWTIALGTIALRFLREIEWKKAVAISGIAYIMCIFLTPLLLLLIPI